jgi:hypothetical protein
VGRGLACACGHGTRGPSADPGTGHALDGVAEVLHARGTCPSAPDTRGAGALAVNVSSALMLVRYRQHAGSLTRAAFPSERNDVLANIAIVGAGLVTAYVPSVWPDLIVGLGIAGMNADAAREVYTAAQEHRTAGP